MNIRYLGVIAMAGLLTSTAAEAGALTYICVGEEWFYPKTMEDREQKVTQQSRTVRLELDRLKNTMTLRDTAQADGTGPTRADYGLFSASYGMTLDIFGMTYNHVLISLFHPSNRLAVSASTHPILEPGKAEGRVLFMGTCRLSAAGDDVIPQ